MIDKWITAWNKRHNPLRGVTAYQLYYGHLDDAVLQTLKRSKMAIVEPAHHSSAATAAMREAGTLPIGYISVLESPRWNVQRFDRLNDSDFLRIDGERVHFREWDSYLMNLAEPHYQRILMEEIADVIDGRNFQGLLLDTVADLDEYAGRTERRMLLDAYLQLLAAIRSRYPGIALIQNRGFGFIDQAAPWLDGLLWENWDGGWRDNGWMVRQVRTVRKLQRRGLRIFTLNMKDEATEDAAEAEALGFIHLSKPNGYLAI